MRQLPALSLDEEDTQPVESWEEQVSNMFTCWRLSFAKSLLFIGVLSFPVTLKAS